MIIRDRALQARILEQIGDEQARSILLAAMLRPKSAAEISRETGLPLSSTYRKIAELQEVGLLAPQRFAFTQDGKKVELYRSTARVVEVRLTEAGVELRLVPNEDMADKLYRLISYMREKNYLRFEASLSEST